MAERWVYFIRPVGEDGPVKIGVSQNPRQRLRAYLNWSPVPLEIAAVIPGDHALEGRFHSFFEASHSHHEWFHASEEMRDVINAINTGEFDITSLPIKGRPATSPKLDANAAAYCGAATKLSWMRKRGIAVPPELSSAGSWLESPEQTAIRRARVIAFVAAHDANRHQRA